VSTKIPTVVLGGTGYVAGELLRLMDRMEQRLEVLERVVRDEPRIEDTLLETGEQRPEMRRKK